MAKQRNDVEVRGIRVSKTTVTLVGTAPLVLSELPVWAARLSPTAKLRPPKRLAGDAVPRTFLMEAIRAAARKNESPILGRMMLLTEHMPLKFRSKRPYEPELRLGKATVYDDWSLALPFEYVEDTVGVDSIFSVLSHAGKEIGIGLERPDLGGKLGTFRVAFA